MASLCNAARLSRSSLNHVRQLRVTYNIHPRLLPYIRHPLDTEGGVFKKYLILLALPRGLEPLFSP